MHNLDQSTPVTSRISRTQQHKRKGDENKHSLLDQEYSFGGYGYGNMGVLSGISGGIHGSWTSSDIWEKLPLSDRRASAYGGGALQANWSME